MSDTDDLALDQRDFDMLDAALAAAALRGCLARLSADDQDRVLANLRDRLA